MKKIISVFLSLALVAGFAQAQNNKQDQRKGGNDWRERVRAEQVAFITSELDLSESEAQAFWPVYNDVQKQRREAFKATGEAFKALQEGANLARIKSQRDLILLKNSLMNNGNRYKRK